MRTLSTLCADLSSVASKWFFFFFNDTATTEIYTLSLHDALPICRAHPKPADLQSRKPLIQRKTQMTKLTTTDRKSTRLNSSHLVISYAVFCLKKKNSLESSSAALLLSSY